MPWTLLPPGMEAPASLSKQRAGCSHLTSLLTYLFIKPREDTSECLPGLTPSRRDLVNQWFRSWSSWWKSRLLPRGNVMWIGFPLPVPVLRLRHPPPEQPDSLPGVPAPPAGALMTPDPPGRRGTGRRPEAVPGRHAGGSPGGREPAPRAPQPPSAPRPGVLCLSSRRGAAF